MGIEGICTHDIEGIERMPRQLTMEDLREREENAAFELRCKIAAAMEAEKKNNNN